MSGIAISHIERMERLLRSEELDRPPVSAWRHFYGQEWSAENLASAMLNFQREYDWDFMKINPRAAYYVEDWGCRFGRPADDRTKPSLISGAVAVPDDWLKIKELDILSGAFGEQLRAVKLIGDSLNGTLDYVQTVFSPLSIAADLVGSDELFGRLLEERTNLEVALEAISRTLVRYVKELLRLGVSGIFFATTEWGTRDRISEEEYLEFGRPFDLLVLEAAAAAKFNIVHVCKQNNLLPMFKDYPCRFLSWNKHEPGNLDFAQAKYIFSQAFIGGIDQNGALLNSDPAEIDRQYRRASLEAEGHPLVIAPGCAMKVFTPSENIRALRDCVGD